MADTEIKGVAGPVPVHLDDPEAVHLVAGDQPAFADGPADIAEVEVIDYGPGQ
ncbi:hypothetical protein [Actinomyces lilanjuaniae]|uniref:hypothetical protein n=1 Tax=Actinomyces lilanjuaniae TaxID=2321394 RepID=UPI0013C4A6E5|nr:hypothetical protein [Actinomyces lilanjuaniae]